MDVRVNIYFFTQNLYRDHFGFFYQLCSKFGNVSLARFEKLFFFSLSHLCQRLTSILEGHLLVLL